MPHKIDERIKTVHFTKDLLVVDLRDGRSISVPLTWYPRLLNATNKQRASWEIVVEVMVFIGQLLTKIYILKVY